MGETGKSRRAERSAPGPGFASGVSPSMRSTLDADLLRDLLCRSTWVFVRVVTKIGQSPKRQDGTVLATCTTINDGVSPFCSVSTPVRMNRFRRDLRCSKRKLSPTVTPSVQLVSLSITFDTRSSIRQEPYTERSGFWCIQQLSPDVTTGLEARSPQIMLYLNRGLTGTGVSPITFRCQFIAGRWT